MTRDYSQGPRGDGSVLGSGRLDQVNLMLAERMRTAEDARRGAQTGPSLMARLTGAVEGRIHHASVAVDAIAAAWPSVDPPAVARPHHALLHLPAHPSLHLHH